MPTLSSIEVHQLIRDKLSRLDPPIETPQALLSRDPSSLAQAMAVPIDELLMLRSEVAAAVIAEGGNGKRALHIHGTLQQRSTINSDTDDGISGDNNHHSSFILGSVTARDLCYFESLRGVSQKSVSTGSHQLDQLLRFPLEYSNSSLLHPAQKSRLGEADDRGGVPFGYVTQLAGPPASGKTQLALVAAANHATKFGGKTVFYLGSGALLPLAFRLKYICKENPNINQVCQGVVFAPVANGHEVLSSLLEIEATHLRPSRDDLVSPPTPILIILDSVSGCLSEGLYSAGDRVSSTSLVRQVACELRRISRQHDVAVLVTNGTVSSKDGNSFKAAMGQYWRVADVTLWLETLNDAGWSGQDKAPGLSLSFRRTVRATLEDHPAMMCQGDVKDRTATFDITATGITASD